MKIVSRLSRLFRRRKRERRPKSSLMPSFTKKGPGRTHLVGPGGGIKIRKRVDHALCRHRPPIKDEIDGRTLTGLAQRERLRANVRRGVKLTDAEREYLNRFDGSGPGRG